MSMVMEFTLNKVAGCGNADLLETGDCVTSCLYFFLMETYYLVKYFQTATFPFIHSRLIFLFYTSYQTLAMYRNGTKTVL